MMSPQSRHSLAIRLAAGLAGYCTFINLYSPQAILPLLSTEFSAGPAEVASVMTVGTLAVALMAPFSGTAADVIGRKRVIVMAMFVLAIPTFMAALAPTLHALIVWRFLQGLAMPPIFAVMIAYVGEELTPQEATATIGFYTSGASIGGFSGRLLTGIFADVFGWRYGFAFLGTLVLFGAVTVAFLLPRERKFVRSEGLIASATQMLRHFRNPQLLATYSVGFGVLFNFLVTFTYINFRLAHPPYSLSPGWLGAIFIVYLAGSLITPWTGAAVGRFGRRHVMIATLSIWIGGIALTLLDPLWTILLGLAMSAACGLLCQAVSTGYVAITAQVGRSSAVGLYVTCYNLGGSAGAALGGFAWVFGGWPACVAMVILVIVIMAIIVATTWSRGSSAPQAPAIEPA